MNGTTEVQSEFDGEQFFYIDFQRKEVVFTVPTFIDADPRPIVTAFGLLKDALENKIMRQTLQELLKHEINPKSEEKGKYISMVISYFKISEQMLMKPLLVYWPSLDPPESIIFPSREVEPGVENSLVCLANNFYPTSIKVSWTKNGLAVVKGVSLS